MSSPPASPPASPSDQFVTSSDLVRHFGLWQERAARAPLYILHRGRPRFVLTSIETMEALCAPHTPDAASVAAGADSATILLDTVSDLVLFTDEAGAIIGSSRAARAHFGDLAAMGGAIEAITPAPTRAFLADAIRRVIASGIGDHLEIASARRAGRMLAVAIEPAGPGVAVIACDGTTELDHVRALAAERALSDALWLAGGLATARINPRGHLVDPTPTLARLTGLSCDTLATLRLVALVEIGARATLGAAIEAAMAGRPPPAIDAALLVNRADPVAVRIALAPVRGASGIDGVIAMIVATGACRTCLG